MKNATDPFKIHPLINARIVQDVRTGEPSEIQCEHARGAKTTITMEKIGKLAMNQIKQELPVPIAYPKTQGDE